MNNKLFYNENGNVYYVLYGGKGYRSLLCDINKDQFVICAMLEEQSWWAGTYFDSFEKAYKHWIEGV